MFVPIFINFLKEFVPEDCHQLMLNFKDKVLRYIKSIPKGKVVSYGQVAAACGSPRVARQVGGILRSADISTGIPWWRVVNNKGIISIKGNWTATKELQRLRKPRRSP